MTRLFLAFAAARARWLPTMSAMTGDWWYENIVEPGKLPMLCCLGAFVVTFILTRAITRMIRAGIGPFRNNVSSSGVHIHHAVPGILLLIFGSLSVIRGPDSPWFEIASAICGIGMSLILDEFALILHLEDVYWTDEGRVSVELAGLTVACIGFVMLGFSPFGVDDLSIGEVSIRLTLLGTFLLNAGLVVICLLKAKYRAALASCFIPLIAWICAIRLARPHSWWARHRYRDKKAERAARRADRFDERWDPKWRWLSDLLAGAPSEPDPPAIPAIAAIPAEQAIPVARSVTDGAAPGPPGRPGESRRPATGPGPARQSGRPTTAG